MASAERRSARRPKVHYVIGESARAGDLVFRDGGPLLVISWHTVAGKRVPYVSFPLDPGKLRASGPVDYVYEGELGR